MEKSILHKDNFIQANSPDGGFLQSIEWCKFQELIGRKTFNISNQDFWANAIEHKLLIVGKYFYIPRGPVTVQPEFSTGMTELINLAKKEGAGWIRFDASDVGTLEFLQKKFQVKRAPHDMQPKEIFIVNLMKSEEQFLADMKSKTRYNIRLAQKHNVKISINQKYLDEFIRLVKITAKRDRITPHPDEYYRKMLKAIPADNLKLYVAEYNGKIIAANMVVFYGKVATYLHGASDNEYRNIMAPYLLQWQAILDAKTAGCEAYDMGGIKTGGSGSWAGITRFKIGFSTVTKPIEFSGSYDIVLNTPKYNIYKILQKLRSLF